MPKIEVNEKLFYQTLGSNNIGDWDGLEKLLPYAKAELDEKSDPAEPAEDRTIKIELNDTNRPDLWSTVGLARQLRMVGGVQKSDYSAIMSKNGDLRDYGSHIVNVDEKLKNIRPFMVSFIISGKPISNAMLKDIIQTQEKLTWNFGRKRKSISMGIYRISDIEFPVSYHAVDPDKTSFTPLGCDEPMTCREILTRHPKGRDYGWILQDKPLFPLLSDARGQVLSMAPIINSNTLGQVLVGDDALMVELTGDNMDNLLLSANIVACDFFDEGYKIDPICCRHPYDTGYGRDIVCPNYFQKPTSALLADINKLLGSNFCATEVQNLLIKMGNDAKVDGDIVTLFPPPYRNDFLHAVDVAEDVMICAGLETFQPLAPCDFTIGKLLPITNLSRKVKSLMVGLGFQEMIFNYVGSKHDYIDNMCLTSDSLKNKNEPYDEVNTNIALDETKVIEIANPMSENYQFIRPEMISSLLRAESNARRAPFPHKTFEIGKVAFLDDTQNTGTNTQQHLGFLDAEENISYNDAASMIQTLLYYLCDGYEVTEGNDKRFIAGRQAIITAGGKKIGIFGEVAPQVLTNWAITTPAIAGEINIEELL